jgi:hypothetical protein
MSGRADELQLQYLRKELLTLRQQLAVRPINSPIKSVYSPLQIVVVIGGQTLSGITGVNYAADPITAPTAYNPNTSTSYIAGLGYGMLYNAQGQQVGKVNIRHNYAGFPYMLIAGRSYACSPFSTTVPVTGGGTIPVYPVVRI